MVIIIMAKHLLVQQVMKLLIKFHKDNVIFQLLVIIGEKLVMLMFLLMVKKLVLFMILFVKLLMKANFCFQVELINLLFSLLALILLSHILLLSKLHKVLFLLMVFLRKKKFLHIKQMVNTVFSNIHLVIFINDKNLLKKMIQIINLLMMLKNTL